MKNLTEVIREKIEKMYLLVLINTLLILLSVVGSAFMKENFQLGFLIAFLPLPISFYVLIKVNKLETLIKKIK